jgi:hypothetical protein
MGDTFIPGDDLEQLTQMLPQIKQLVSSAKDVTEKYAPLLGLGYFQGGIFGDQEVSAAVGVFQSKWSDGDYQLGKEIDNLTGIANNILSSFQQTDQDLLDELEGKTPPGQSESAQARNSLTLGAPLPKGQVDGRPQPKIG